jgi:type I restriction enzyme S subunit
LEFWLNNSLLQQYVMLQIAGAAIRRISIEKVGRLPVLLPTLAEQKLIVDYLRRELSKLDALVNKVEAAIDLLIEYRSALVASAVTGKIDVREVTQ